MTVATQSPTDEGFQSTIDHAMRLHAKWVVLDRQIRESLEVAGSIAGKLGVNLSDPQLLVDTVVALRAQDVPGRGRRDGRRPPILAEPLLRVPCGSNGHLASGRCHQRWALAWAEHAVRLHAH